MDDKTTRWFLVAFFAAIISFIVSCTVAYVAHPHETQCMIKPASTSGCDK
jgi:hypothetical protein